MNTVCGAKATILAVGGFKMSHDVDSRTYESPQCDIGLSQKLEFVAIGLSLACMFFGIAVVIGWILQIPLVVEPSSAGVTVKANTGVGFIISALGLLLIIRSERRAGAKSAVPLIPWLGLLLIMLSGTSLLEWILAVDLGFDQLIAPDTFSGSQPPGRMAPNTAACFVLFGTSLLGPRSDQWSRFAIIANTLVFFTALVGFCGYIYGLEPFYRVMTTTDMAFNTSVTFLLLSAARAFTFRDQLPVSLIVSKTSGGFLARRLLPAAILIPIFIGLIEPNLESLGLIEHGFGVAIVVVSMAIIVSAVSYWLSYSLTARDIASQKDAQQIARLNREFMIQNEILNLKNRELAVAKDIAERASVIKSNFIANISHELRTPLSGIIGANDLLLNRQHMDPEQIELHGTIKQSAEGLLRLINDLIDISRIESGMLPIHPTRFSAIEVVSDVTKSMRRSIPHSVKLQTSVGLDIPKELVGDQQRIKQVLMNLLSNAIKFTSSGEINVRVAKRIAPAGAEFVSFSVEDTGIGISKDDQARLFTPFTQLDTSPTRQYAGAGLGLAISKQLVELMDGSIMLKSTPGKGSIFSFDLPLTVPVGPAPAIAEVSAIPQCATSSATVLIVEDNLVVQKLVLKQLEKLGVTAVAASTGREALKLLRSFRFDLILMDYNLPDVTGVVLTRAIRNCENRNCLNRTRIVAMTAAAMKGDREKCLLSGMDDYLSKPVSFEQLRQTVAKFVPPPSSPQTSIRLPA